MIKLNNRNGGGVYYEISLNDMYFQIEYSFEHHFYIIYTNIYNIQYLLINVIILTSNYILIKTK